MMEGGMKRQWTVHRQLVAYPDGLQRWDRAYQYLLQWSMPVGQASTPSSPSTSELSQEVNPADRHLRARVDPKPGRATDD